ncbi:redoxin domain-containing protein [Novosphingobium sp.]|jgi:hypothetical protein|uniref:redoxin domain-containing protein n=1 Tax=Novosphingobium sp. TaxID=1874826 RepID=UPI002FDF891E
MMMTPHDAPPLDTSDWLNSDKPLDLADFRGRVLVIEAFQMLCPGCVAHGLPQVQRVAQMFAKDRLAVIGLHTVFEHHEAQGTRAALAAFAHEYRLGFPIGIDRQDGRLPATMTAYQMQGTPTLVIIDALGRRRFQHFGHVDDLTFGHVLGTLLTERLEGPSTQQAGCDPDEGCAIKAAPE